ncbi:hypothetical protein LSCM1_06051 [Leishmania martiniquensis]|uniref:SET domain-containing protein n=1 Tax=Leishmania martiniquensis TaxID=1580590 RepID=A0A836GB17_9TRYP|nr:hypothetical protein LSCM1_06051 [Leishmania martiniquensis]
MPSYESRHMLRVLDSPQTLANSFIDYCKRHHVKTRGWCRIGYVRRSPPRNANVNPDSCRLRGLIANEDIAKDESVVMMPVTACLHPGAAFRCEPFWRLLAPEVQSALSSVSCAYNSRIADRSLIRHNQLLLALYMTYLMLLRNCDAAQLSTTPGGDAIEYINFMPRNEGNFEQLAAHLACWLDAPEICRSAQASLASHFQLTQAEVRPVIIYALCMIYSRMVPVDHRACLQYALQSTPLAHAWDDVEATAAPAALPPSSSAGNDGGASGGSVHSGGANTSLVRDPISFLCPVIDMCNHSDHENVAVMVPDRDNLPVTGPVICLRTLRPVTKGEELTMTYGAAPHELKLIWGMQDIFQ